MTASEWRLRLAELSAECANALAEEEGDFLQSAYDLMSLAPDAGLDEELVAHLPPQARFEALLALGAHETAALALVPERASYILSRAGVGGAMASVLLAGMEDELTSEADSPALALISALAACLAQSAVQAPLRARSKASGRGESRPEIRSCGQQASDVTIWLRPEDGLLH